MGINKSKIAKLSSSDTDDWYTKTDKIGRGAFGDVYKCRLKETGETFALKIINKKLFEEKSKRKLDGLGEYLLEMNISHEHIIQIFGRKSTADKFLIYMEYAELGSIADLYVQNGPLIDHQVGLFTKQILSAISYLHANNIIHRDIKCQNILLTNYYNVKLSDFGIATVLKKQAQRFSTNVGTPYFMAPEVNAGRSYDFSADIWSLGVTVLEMKLGEIPNQLNNLYDDSDPLAYYNKETFLSYFSKQFMKKCLKKSPAERATIEELQNEPICHIQHYTREEISVLIRDLKDCSSLVEKMKSVYSDWREKRILVIGMLSTMIRLFHHHRADKSKCGIAGGAAGVAGGIISIVGLSLAPFTAGASLVVSIVGVSLGSVGGIVSSGGAIGEAIHRKNLKQKFQEKFTEEKNALNELTNILESIFNYCRKRKLLNRLYILNSEYYYGFRSNSATCSFEIVTKETLYKPLTIVRIFGVASDVVEVILKPASIGARVVFRIASGILNMLFVAVDAFYLYKGIKDLKNGKKHPDTKEIRDNLTKMIEGLDKMDKFYKLFDPDAVITKIAQNLDAESEENELTEIEQSYSDIFLKEFKAAKEKCPEVDEYDEEKTRLVKRVRAFGGIIFDTQYDGNCLFEAVGTYFSDKTIGELRELAVENLRAQPHNASGALIERFIERESWEQYLKRMGRNGEWADENMIFALSRALKMSVRIISSRGERYDRTIGNSGQNSIIVGHIFERHYVAIRRNREAETQTFSEMVGNEQYNTNDRCCIVCLDAERQTIFLPCAHICCCQKCSVKLLRCPTCREEINETKKFYIS